jgi:hypothetical protein
MPHFRLRLPRAAAGLAPVLLLLAGACATTPAAPAKNGEAKGDQDAKAEKAQKLAAELEDARAELKLAEMEAGTDAIEAREALDDARLELDEAKLAITRWREVEKPSEIAGGQLAIERAEQALDEDVQELGQMEAMYAAEPNMDPTNVATRDMVLGRYKKRIEFSTRALVLTRTKYQDDVTAGLPLEERELETKSRAAERALRKAESALQKGEIESARALAKARQRVSELERKVFKAAAGDEAPSGKDGDEEPEQE